MKNKCYIIAEAGLNHNGSIEIAKKLIDLAVKAGADAVKFQKRTVDVLAIETVLDAEDNRFPEFGNTYREIRDFLEFDLEEYKELKNYSEDKGLDFMVTAFDIGAVDFLNQVGVEKIKLASHSLTNYDLLEYLAEQNKETILSTGMAKLEEIDLAVEIFVTKRAPLSLMHCVSAYPTPPDECNIKMMDTLIHRYGLPTGYSGHELGYLPTLTAVAMGAVAIERHYTLDNDMMGFDHKMSLNPDDLIAMVKAIRDIEKIKGTGEKNVSETEWITRNKYHVSMVSSRNILKNDELTNDMISYRNPGTGIPAKDAHKVIGRRAVKDIIEGELLSFDLFT